MFKTPTELAAEALTVAAYAEVVANSLRSADPDRWTDEESQYRNLAEALGKAVAGSCAPPEKAEDDGELIPLPDDVMVAADAEACRQIYERDRQGEPAKA